MPYTREEWRAAIGTDINKLNRALDLIEAHGIARVAPVGFQDEDKYQLPMSPAQRQAIRDEFVSEIQAVIADLQAGLV